MSGFWPLFLLQNSSWKHEPPLMFCIRFFLYEIFDEEVLFKLDTFCSLQHPMIFFGVSPFCRPGLSSGHLRCQRLRCSYCVTSTCPPESPTSDSDSHHDPTSSPKLLWSHPWKKNCPRSLFAIWPGWFPVIIYHHSWTTNMPMPHWFQATRSLGSHMNRNVIPNTMRSHK